MTLLLATPMTKKTSNIAASHAIENFIYIPYTAFIASLFANLISEPLCESEFEIAIGQDPSTFTDRATNNLIINKTIPAIIDYRMSSGVFIGLMYWAINFCLVQKSKTIL